MNCLIIENDHSLAALIRLVLRQNYSDSTFQCCHSCSDAQEIIRSFMKGHFDLVISDMVFEDGDGFQIQSCIKDLGLDQTGLIFISPMTSKDMRRRAETDGAYTIIYRPFRPEVLVTAVDDYFSLQKQMA